MTKRKPVNAADLVRQGTKQINAEEQQHKANIDGVLRLTMNDNGDGVPVTWPDLEASYPAEDLKAVVSILEPIVHPRVAGFRPPARVAKAMLRALAFGESRAAAKHALVQDTCDVQYREAQTGIVRATVAALIEASWVGQHPLEFTAGFNTIEKASVTMDIEAQRTIWDRYELETSRDESGKYVNFTITRKK